MNDPLVEIVAEVLAEHMCYAVTPVTPMTTVGRCECGDDFEPYEHNNYQDAFTMHQAERVVERLGIEQVSRWEPNHPSPRFRVRALEVGERVEE